MDGSNPEALLMRGRYPNRKRGKTSSGRSKSRGKSRFRLMSLDQSTRRCWHEEILDTTRNTVSQR